MNFAKLYLSNVNNNQIKYLWGIMKILLIDDDVSSLNNLATTIRPSGHQCECFSDPQAALDSYEQAPYDVVISDVRMHGLNGIEVLKKIRTINSQAKVILITAYGDVETAVAAVNHKAYAFLSKPIDFEELMGLLNKIALEHDENLRIVNKNGELLLIYARLKQVYIGLQNLINP